MNELKYCKFCDKEKPVKDFCKSGFAIKNICKECQNKKQTQIYRNSKKVDKLQKQLTKEKDNWNKLKEKTNEGTRICRNKGYDLVFGIEEIPKEELDDFLSYLAFQVMEQLIINIEQGSDSNEI